MLGARGPVAWLTWRDVVLLALDLYKCSGKNLRSGACPPKRACHLAAPAALRIVPQIFTVQPGAVMQISGQGWHSSL